MTSADLLKKIEKAIRRLEASEGRPVARRHARHEFLEAMRLLRALVDTSFPSLTERKRKSTAGLSSQQRFERARVRLLEAGWVQSMGIALAYSAAGGKLRKLRMPVDGTGTTYVSTYWIPTWAKQVHPKEIARLIKDRQERKRRLAELALAQLGEPRRSP